jgi:PD-(D/E)XK nuclease superfamily
MTKLQRLSQGHLKALSECPRKFEYIYMASLFSPTEPEQYQNMQLGSDFHRLMHQQALGLPIEPFLAHDAGLQATLLALQQVAPQLWQTPAETLRESEQVRTLLVADRYLFTVIYDLVLLGEKAQIIDWKTHGRPRQPERLAMDWQTRLYLYLLAETSDYAPADISFAYWFVRGQPPTSIVLPYSAALHAQTATDLEAILHRLTAWLAAYPQNLPKIEAESPLCQKCHFAARCDRLTQPTSSWMGELALERLSLADIAEVPL